MKIVRPDAVVTRLLEAIRRRYNADTEAIVSQLVTRQRVYVGLDLSCLFVAGIAKLPSGIADLHSIALEYG